MAPSGLKELLQFHQNGTYPFWVSENSIDSQSVLSKNHKVGTQQIKHKYLEFEHCIGLAVSLGGALAF